MAGCVIGTDRLEGLARLSLGTDCGQLNSEAMFAKVSHAGISRVEPQISPLVEAIWNPCSAAI
jgi:hypothetical protein